MKPKRARLYLADAAAAGRVAVRRPTAARRPLPDFLIIGAQKAGTTTLYGALRAHPRVVPAFRKEVHGFDSRHHGDIDWYRSHFPLASRRRRVEEEVGGPTLTGEASPFYLAHPAVPERVRAVVPSVRLIVVLRDPVARAISGYHHAVRFGFESRPIEEALDPEHEDPVPPAGDLDGWYDRAECPVRRRGYLIRSRYAEQLERWRAHFPDDQLLVLDSAELRSGEGATRAMRFLGLPEHVTPVADRNVGDYASTTSDPINAGLRTHFAPHDARLWELLGRRLSWAD